MHTRSENAASIRLFVIFNSREGSPELPRTEVLEPVDSDAAQGRNIADRQAFCELRAHYAVWKNRRFRASDLVGLFHFRRYLDFSGPVFAPDAAPKGARPYRFAERPDLRQYTRERLRERVGGFDVIAPLPEFTGIPVWIRYERRHGLAGLTAARRVIARRYPEDLPAYDAYLNGSREYYCNLFVMRWERYCRYCEWLFDILEGVRGGDGAPLEASAYGYLGERLFGVYYTKLRQDPEIRCGELPRVHFWAYDDAKHHFRRDRVCSAVLPPGSMRRRLAWRLMNQRRYRPDEYAACFNDRCSRL